MIQVLVILFCAAVVSFVGSLQLGPVNVMVINTVLHHTKRAAWLVALGGCIPEFIYSALAVYFGQHFTSNSVFNKTLSFFSIILFAAMGVYFVFKKTKSISLENNSLQKANTEQNFYKGLALASFNPQLLPFWFFIFLSFNDITLLNVSSSIQKIAFVLGAGVGAFALLSLFIFLAHKYKTKIISMINLTQINIAIGAFFLIIALRQLISLL
jgi:threonine/homoserine/homoserine lactone efflux protein